MRKRGRNITLIGSIGIFFVLALTLLLINTYHASSFDLPSTFGGLADFVSSKTVFYAEFPSIRNDWQSLNDNPKGRALLEHPLTRQLIPARLGDTLHRFIRRLHNFAGIQLETESWFDRLQQPFAVMARYNTDNTDINSSNSSSNSKSDLRWLYLLKTANNDRLLINLFANLASLAKKEKKLHREDWQGVTIYSFRNTETSRYCFALVNNILLTSRHPEDIKTAVSHAARKQAARPASWSLFLQRTAGNRKAPASGARFYLHRHFFYREIPSLVQTLALPPAENQELRMLYLRLNVRPHLNIEGGLTAKKLPKAIPHRTIRYLPASSRAGIAKSSFSFAKLQQTALIQRVFRALPSLLQARIKQLFGECRGPWLGTLHSFRQNGQRSLAPFSLIWKLDTKESTESTAAQKRLYSLIQSIPGANPEKRSHLNTPYFSLRARKDLKKPGQAFIFPSLAIFDNHLFFCLDEEEMKEMIGLYRGRSKARLDSSAFLRDRQQGQGLLLWFHVDIQQILANLYTAMHANAGQNSAYSTREVSLVFQDIRRTPFPLTAIAGAVTAKNSTEANFHVHLSWHDE